MLGKLISPLLILFFYQILYVPLILLSFSRSSSFTEHIESFDVYTRSFIFLTLVIITVFYVFIFHFFNKKQVRLSFKNIFLIALPLYAILLMSQPMFSRDLYVYAVTGRNSCNYGINPYEQGWNSEEVTQDSWVKNINDGWRYTGITPYGPVFSLLINALGCTSKNIFIVTFFLKIIMFSAFVYTGYLLYKSEKNEEQQKKIFLIYLLNPALLIHFVLDGHNNILAILLVVMAFTQKGVVRSWFTYSLAVLIRYLYIIFVPALFFVGEKLLSKRNILGFVAFSVTGMGLYLVYGFPVSNVLKGLSTVSKLPCLYGCNFVQFFIHGFLMLPEYSGYIIFFFLYVSSLYLFLIKRPNVWKFTFIVYTGFLFLTIKWLAPWYFMLSIVAAMNLFSEKKYFYLMYFLTIYSFFRYFGF